MQVKKALAAAAVSVLGLTAGVATPASAGAQPMKETIPVSDCFTDEDPSFPPYTYCVNGSFTTKFIDKGHDTFLAKTRSALTQTVSENGVVIEEGASRSSFMVMVRNGEEVVLKERGAGQFGNCTFDFKLLVVKGVVKQNIDNFQCDGEVIF